MANKLEAIISADGSSFNKTLGELEKQLKRFQDGLKNAGNVESFNRIQRAIDATKSKLASLNGVQANFNKTAGSSTQTITDLSRVLQDAPYGFIGIANNLNPLIEGFGRLKQQTGSTGSAFKALLGSLTGPAGIGLALGALTSVLSFVTIGFGAWTRGIGDSTKELTEGEKAVEGYKDTVEDLKEKVDALTASIQFLNQLGGINIKTSGLGELLDLQGQSISQAGLTQQLRADREAITKEYQKQRDNQELTRKDQIKLEEEYVKGVADIDKKILDSERAQTLIHARIRLQKVEDQKKAEKESKEAYDKYVKDTIAKAKELADFLDKFTIRSFNFDVDPRDSLQKTFSRALDFINKATNDQRSFDIKLNANVILEKVSLDNAKKLSDSIAKDGYKTAEDLNKAVQAASDKNPIRFKIEVDRAEGEKRFAEFFRALGLSNIAKDSSSLLTDTQKEIINTANLVDSILTPSFEGFFDALLDGGRGFDGFFDGLKNAIKSIVRDVGVAILKALVLKGILSAFGGGSGTSFFDIFKGILGFRAAGGPVTAGGSYIVGEKGPELFTPNVGGRIVSNSDMNNGSVGSFAMQPLQISGRLVAQGNDLVAVLAATNRSQNRLT